MIVKFHFFHKMSFYWTWNIRANQYLTLDPYDVEPILLPIFDEELYHQVFGVDLPYIKETAHGVYQHVETKEFYLFGYFVLNLAVDEEKTRTCIRVMARDYPPLPIDGLHQSKVTTAENWKQHATNTETANKLLLSHKLVLLNDIQVRSNHATSPALPPTQEEISYYDDVEEK